MIIFELEDVLADCSKRRHFINPHSTKWFPTWEVYHQACDIDEWIEIGGTMVNWMHMCEEKVQIWTGRPEKTREKTINWLIRNLGLDYFIYFCEKNDLKMRPEGDNRPKHEIKKQWIKEHLLNFGEAISCVFECDPDCIKMWRNMNIPVFECKLTKSGSA